MIGIAAQTYDLDGARIFRNQADDKNRNGERRLVRTATLDGGVSIADLGYSAGDRDIVVVEPDAALAAVDFARYIVEGYSLVTVTASDGAYLAAPGSYDLENGVLTIKLLIAEKLSE